MAVQYLGLHEITGPLIALDNVTGISYDEVARIRLDDGSVRMGRVVQIDGSRAVLQVFEGTKGLSLTNTRTAFTGKPMELALSEELLGRVFSGAGAPIDGLGDIYAEKYADINGRPLNPVARSYPRNYINTGISSIDALTTLIRGQKLPIFSGSGLSHNKLAVQIVRQARIAEDSGQDFAVVFAAMGVKNDVADYFRRSFEESGVLQRVVMFLNLANDPIIGRVLIFQGRDPRKKGISRISLLRPCLPLRESRGHRRVKRVYHTDTHTHHAKRRYHTPYPRPYRVYHRGTDRAGA